MSATQELLKARFAFVRQDLDEVLARLNDSDLDWSPVRGMPTVDGLLLEIANKEKETIAWLQTGNWPDDEPDAFELEEATISNIKLTLASLRSATYAYIDSFSEAGLAQLIQCPERWWEALRLAECPRSEILRNIAVHEWYHTGQLVTYLWLRGDNPNDW